VLSSHEKRNHDTGNLVLGNLCAVLVLAIHQVPDHVVGILLCVASSALAHNLRVQVDHCLARIVACAVVGKRCPRKHKVDGREAHVEVVVEFGKLGVEGVSDFLALERVRGGVDGELSHDLWHVESTLVSLEVFVALDEILDFLCNDGNVGAEGFLCETELDKLFLR
jgi:hypothetical protein